MIAGADGCRGGWLVLFEDVGAIDSGLLPTRAEILDLFDPLKVLAIDIPIGIPDRGSRTCDIEARKALKPRGSCVFPAPVRATFAARDYTHACELHQTADGRKVSKQAHAILPKIIEVDEAVRTHARRSVVYEVHPEVSFRELSGSGLATKHSLIGLHQRLSLIESTFGSGSFSAIRERHSSRTVKDDDILDAFAALWTARRIRDGVSERLPAEPVFDSHGVPMHIHY